MIAKAMGLYERDNDQEKLKIPGPIKHEITVNVRCLCEEKISLLVI